MGVEYLNKTLARFYGPKAIYVERIRRLGKQDLDGVKMALCLYTPSLAQVSRRFDPPALDRIELDSNGVPMGFLDVTAKHAVDHFKEIRVFPGHKVIRAAAAYLAVRAGPTFDCKSHIDQIQIRGFDSVAFKGVVLPDLPDSQLRISLKQEDPLLQARVIEIKRGKKVVAEIAGLDVRLSQERSFRGKLLPDQLIEAMAQAAAVTALNLGEELNGIPMFQSIGSTRFWEPVFEGSQIVMMTKTKPEGRGFSGDVEAFVDKEKVAESFGLKAMIIPKRLAERMLGVKLTG